MRNFVVRLINVMFGLLLYGLGIVVTIKANVGYAPWDVLNVGLADKTGLSLGTMSILIGLVLILVCLIFKEKIGLGSILNMIIIGLFIDLFMGMDAIPMASGMISGVIMLIGGLFIVAVGSYFYIKAGFGAGPRDSLMVILERKTRLSVGVCRAIIEFTVMVVGWFLGGMVGVGTLITIVGIGACVQIVFKAFKFDPTRVNHETLAETYASLFGKKIS